MKCPKCQHEFDAKIVVNIKTSGPPPPDDLPHVDPGVRAALAAYRKLRPAPPEPPEFDDWDL
jgi:hypothetical protein